MDQAMVNIGWDEAYNGEEVVLLGEQGAECIQPDELARWAETISYEIMCTISARVPRYYLSSEASETSPAKIYDAPDPAR